MPINLDAADKLFMSAKADTHRPTYFCSELTGGYTVTGKLRNSGTLRPESDPGAFPAGTRKLNRDDIDVYRRTISNAGTTTYLIPIDLATADMWTRAFDNIELASRNGAIPIAEQTVRLCGATTKVCAYMTLDAHSVVIEKTKTDSGYVRNARIVWRVSTWLDSCGSAHPAAVIHSQPYPAHSPSPNQMLRLCSNTTNAVNVAFVADVPGYLEETLDAFIAAGWTVDAQAAYDALVDIHSYDKIADAADRWQTAIDEDFAKTTDAIVSCVGADQAIRHVHNLVHRLEAYPVPLNLYIKIYNYLKSKFPDYALDEIVESNLNLLMTDTMQRLDDAKSTLETCPVNPQAQASAFFNGGQRAAIESHDPLVMVQSAAGTGKALPVDEPVLTPEGWKPMGELTLDDQVIGSDGKPHRILHIVDQGVRPGYLVKFYDGSSVRCDEDHLWTFEQVTGYDRNHRSTRTAKQWTETSFNRWHLPIVKPIEFEAKNLPIDPYLLGALLADGSLHLRTIRYTKNEQAVIDEVAKACTHDGRTLIEATPTAATVRYFNMSDDTTGDHRYTRLRDEIADLGLRVKSVDKFIPEIYKFGSVEQRIAIINGLFDGDGTIRTHRGYAHYSTRSERLAHDVLEVLWSLGVSARLDYNKHKRGDYWIVKCYSPEFNPFRASGNHARYQGTKRTVHRKVMSFTPIEPCEMRCIAIDSDDHLFVTKDYALTHNSSTLKGRIQYMVDSGIDPHDITVLSFTNAAADHIRDICPDINSMTISSMVHTIYQENFSHELSSIPTLLNSLDIWFPRGSLASDLKHYLRAVDAHKPDAFTRLNSFVKTNYDGVIGLLDGCGQTTLELEIVIAYQKIGTFIEPPEVSSRHLLVDEVQDNSIFDFVYILEYVLTHKESLFIVGRRIADVKPYELRETRAYDMRAAA